MGNALLSYEDWISASATMLATDSEVGGLSVTNVAERSPKTPWRTTNTSAYLQADFGANREIGVLALVVPRTGVQLAATDTVRHRLDADGGTAGTGALLDTGIIASGFATGYGYHVYVLTTAVQARYWRCDISAASLSSYFQIGRAWAGPAWRPERNFSYGHAETWLDESRVSVAPQSGVDFVDLRDRRRAMAFALDFMTDADVGIARELKRVAGISEQILFVRAPDSTDVALLTVLGTLTGTLPILQPALPVHATAFEIRESL